MPYFGLKGVSRPSPRICGAQHIRGGCPQNPIEAAIKQLKAEGYPVLDADVARISPLIFHHINMLGRYLFSVPDEVSKGELRPLRNPADKATTA